MGLNPVRDKLMRGEVSLGCWLNLVSPMAAEVLAVAGFDWLVVDAEHSQWDMDSLTHAFRAIEARGAVPMARAWSHDPTVLARLLDAGAMGIVLPHTSTPEQAEAAAKAMRFPPRGERSAGSGRATLTHPDYRKLIDDAVLVIPQIEDMQGVENTEAIMSVAGVDVAFIGPNDLATSMGIPVDRQWKDPRHLDAIAKVLEGAKRAGKPAGVPVADGAAARKAIEQGFLFIDTGSDMRKLRSAAVRELEIARG